MQDFPMIWLLTLVLLTAAGIFIAYSLSAAAKARKRASKAVAALRAVDSELRSQYREIQSSVSQATNSYMQEVRARRVEAAWVWAAPAGAERCRHTNAGGSSGME
jgi:hypothetical protein